MNSTIQNEKINIGEKISGTSFFIRFIPERTFPDQWKKYAFAVFYDINCAPLLIVPLVPKEYKITLGGQTKNELLLEFPKSTRLEKMLDIPSHNPNPKNITYTDEYFFDVRDTLVLIGNVKSSSYPRTEPNNNVCYYTLHQQNGAPINWTEAPYVCFRDNNENEIYRLLLINNEYNSSKTRFDELLTSERKKIVPTSVYFTSCPKTGLTYVGLYDSQKRLIKSQIFLSTNECNTKTGSLDELRALLVNSKIDGIEYDVNITSFMDARRDYDYSSITGKCTIL